MLKMDEEKRQLFFPLFLHEKLAKKKKDTWYKCWKLDAKGNNL